MHVASEALSTFPGASAPAVISMQRSYDRYYSTGLYDSRYPAPNQHLLKLILAELGEEGGRILDFGCGSGRYAIPLAVQPGVSVLGYDISAAAIRDLETRRDQLAGMRSVDLELMCGSMQDLEKRLDGDAGFDLVVMLFGVLGHIPRREQRVATLRSLRARLRPGGRLIATVPNRARRFHAEQKAAFGAVAQGLLEPGDIHYQRCDNGDAIDLYYHLYSPAEFQRELAEAGFTVPRLLPESVLAERAVLTSPACAAADAVLRRVTPVSLAYGFVAVVESPPLAAAA